MKIPLDKPFEYEDYNLTEIDLDLDGKMSSKLKDRIDAEFRTKIKGEPVLVPWLDNRYRNIVAAKVTGIPENVLRELPFKAYNTMHNTIEYFFAHSQEPSSEMPEELAD